MYIHANHVEMDTSKSRNKSIMSIKKRIKISLIWGKHIHARTHIRLRNMFVIENYMHIEHRHTKCMGCLKQHNTRWSSTGRYIYL